MKQLLPLHGEANAKHGVEAKHEARGLNPVPSRPVTTLGGATPNRSAVPSRFLRDATPTSYDEWRLAIENELIRNWRTPLPPNPTPAQELAAWDKDVTLLDRAYQRVLERNAEFERITAAYERRLEYLG